MPAHELHDDVRRSRLGLLAHIEDRDDPWVHQASGCLRFVEKTLPVLQLLVGALRDSRDGFDGDEAVNFGVAGLIDGAHGAAAYFGNDFVASKAFVEAGSHGYTMHSAPRGSALLAVVSHV